METTNNRYLGGLCMAFSIRAAFYFSGLKKKEKKSSIYLQSPFLCFLVLCGSWGILNGSIFEIWRIPEHQCRCGSVFRGVPLPPSPPFKQGRREQSQCHTFSWGMLMTFSFSFSHEYFFLFVFFPSPTVSPILVDLILTSAVRSAEET